MLIVLPSATTEGKAGETLPSHSRKRFPVIERGPEAMRGAEDGRRVEGGRKEIVERG